MSLGAPKLNFQANCETSFSYASVVSSKISDVTISVLKLAGPFFLGAASQFRSQQNSLSFPTMLGLTGLIIPEVKSETTIKTMKMFQEAYLEDVVEDSNGGIYTVGTTGKYFGHNDNSSLRSLAFISKWNQDGSENWTKTWGTLQENQTNSSEGYCITASSDGGVVMGGSTFPNGLEIVSTMHIAKLWPNGTASWELLISGNTENVIGEIYSLQASPSLDIIASGWYGQKSVVLKLTNSGDVVWSKLFGGTESQDVVALRSVILTPNDTIVVGGQAEGADLISWDIFIAKINATGDLLFYKTFGHRYSDQLFALANGQNGETLGTGLHAINSDETAQAFVGSWLTDGKLKWMKVIVGAYEGIAIESDLINGDVIVGGSSGKGGYGVMLSRWQMNGTISWLYESDDSSESSKEITELVITSKSNEIFMTGYALQDEGKYSAFIGLLPLDGHIRNCQTWNQIKNPQLNSISLIETNQQFSFQNWDGIKVINVQNSTMALVHPGLSENCSVDDQIVSQTPQIVLPPWAWVTISVGSAVVLASCGGIFIYLFVRNKKIQKKNEEIREKKRLIAMAHKDLKEKHHSMLRLMNPDSLEGENPTETDDLLGKKPVFQYGSSQNPSRASSISASPAVSNPPSLSVLI